MKILLVAATHDEVKPLLAKLAWEESNVSHEAYNHQLTLLVAGVGMVSTAFSMGTKLALEQFDLAINLGIAGAFDRSLKLGEVVEVKSDQLSEMGAEDGEKFLSLAELGMAEPREFIFENVYAIEHQLKTVRGITVNTVHGKEASIELINKRLNPQVESMEGAAFFNACKMANTSALQLRAISNYVEARNKSNWKIDLAVDNLATETLAILKQL